MSGAFLYVGIVAIWAFVLVPRWLRRSHVQSQAVTELVTGNQAAEVYGGYEESGYGNDGRFAGYSENWRPAPDVRLAGADQRSEGAEATWNDQPGWDGQSGWDSEGETVVGHSGAGVSRAKVLRARRRLLLMLLLLTAAAGACTALKLTSWWACVPPAGLLGMYLLLLRETALADAEQARRRAALELRAQAARQRAQEVWEAREQERSAQIIDISARVGDQLYDQYADATIRAVGD